MERILFVLPRFHTNLFFATRALLNTGHEVSIICNTSSPGEDHRHVDPLVVGNDPPIEALREHWRQLDPTIAIVRDSAGLTRKAWRLARESGALLLAYDLKSTSRIQSLRRRVLKRMRGEPILRVTPIRGTDANKPADPFAFYLPWPVGLYGSATCERTTSDVLRVVCVGKFLQPRKNQSKLIEAVRCIRNDVDLGLTLVGSTGRQVSGSSVAHLEALAAAAESDQISLRTDVPFAEMGQIYAQHDICVLPSLDEPLGVAPIEAMAYGCIPVISRQAGSAGYITHGVDGFVVDMNDPGDLAAKLRRLAMEPDLCAKLRQGAQRTANTELGPVRFTERFSELRDWMGRTASFGPSVLSRRARNAS